jgi:hypothetical protein
VRPAARRWPILRGHRPLSPDRCLLRRLERQVHRGFARGSETREVGAFRIYLWPRPEPFYRNRALPVAEPGDWGPAVADLVRAFAAAGREPRVEFFAELWPGLGAALEAAGVRPGDPIVLVDRWYTCLPARWTVEAATGQARLVSLYRSWLPAAPLDLVRPLPTERSAVYTSRFCQRARLGGWIVYPKAVEKEFAWFFDQVRPTHVRTKSVEKAGWVAAWFDWRGPGAGAGG